MPNSIRLSSHEEGLSMKKISIRKNALLLGLALTLSSCNFMHYQKAITLDEGRSLLNTAYSTISSFDPNSQTEYSFSYLAEKISGSINDGWVSDYEKVNGSFVYNAEAARPWSTFLLNYESEVKAKDEEAVQNEYSVRPVSETTYQILVNSETSYVDYDPTLYPFLEPYFLYSTNIYKKTTENITRIMAEQLNNVGTQGEGKANNLYGYTCLSQGYGDVVILLESWDFSELKSYLEYAGVFNEEDGQRDSYSSINFIEGYFEGGLMVKLVVGYDSEIDYNMKEDGLEDKIKGISDSFKVTFTF